MERIFILFGPQHALDDFESVAAESGFTGERRALATNSAEFTNATPFLQLAFSKEGAAIFIALATVIRGYLSMKASRRITITRMKNGKIDALDARGYSKEELTELLPQCREIIIYDDKKKIHQP
jgi:hypothetical protein